ncbi:MAG: DHH family phosphoesterase, partial [Lachnospiraceae bacterium]|nr:DHH family phosphoesterase [Lachnospiraceae bacterium]
MVENLKKRSICVVGHKNPDTDSICSAISYAYLKNKTDDQNYYVASRAGQITAETQYVLDYFGMDQPLYLDNIGTRVKDMEIREVPGVRSNISIKNAWTLMRGQNVFTLPITDEEDKLHGLITINDIAKSYMEEYDSAIVSMARTPYKNILETLDAEMIVGDENAYFEKGKVVIAAANPDVM